MPELSNYLSQVASTTKPKEKIEITKAHESPFLLYLLKQMMHPHVKFNLKIKPTDIPEPGAGRIEDFEEEIRILLSNMSMNFSHKENLEQVTEIIEQLDEGSQQLLIAVINKKSGVGLSSKGVLKAYPELFEVFYIQKANKFKDKPGTDYEKKYNWSPKLDGVKVFCLREEGKWGKYSRSDTVLGKKFLTLDHWDAHLEKYYQETGLSFLEGEAYKHGLALEEIVGKVKRFSNPEGALDLDFYCFIAGTVEGFKNADSSSFVINELEFGKICRVNGGLLTIPEAIKKVPVMMKNGFEGIMLRDPGNIYDFKKSDALLKLKPMQDMDCKVIAVIYDDFPINENGISSKERMLTNVVVEQENGVLCPVGTGFSLPFRREIYENAYPILGATCQIIYQNLGTHGGMKLPVWDGIRIDK